MLEWGPGFLAPLGKCFSPGWSPYPLRAARESPGKAGKLRDSVEWSWLTPLLAFPSDRAPRCHPLHSPGCFLSLGAVHQLKVIWPLPGSPPRSPSSHAAHGRHSLCRPLSSSSRPASLHSALFPPPHPRGGSLCTTSITETGHPLLHGASLLSRWKQVAGK